MNELIGLAYYAEIPAVIVDVQRVGPSTGMPTRTQQGDILLCAYASHGDTKHICLFPANPDECFHFAVAVRPRRALPDARLHAHGSRHRHERLGRPPPHLGRQPTSPIGARAHREELEALPKYYRYSPEDELGVAARTLPGRHPKGAFFTRGSGHNKLGGYTEIPDEYQEVMDRLLRKHKAARNFVPAA
jgi:2-oxoglutarate ferredoxin oxidoreductase subunit alpha